MVGKASVLTLFTVTEEDWPDFTATELPRASLPFYLKVSQGWNPSFHRDGDSVRDPADV